MTSTFRLTRTEFKKIFKRASVYIMALLLVVAVLISVYIFKPQSTESYTVDYGENLSVENYYDYFYNRDLQDSKKGIDKDYFTNATNILNYFVIESNNDLKLTENKNDVINAIEELRNVSDPAILNSKYNILKDNLQSFYDNFIDFSMYDTTIYPHIYYSSTFVSGDSTTNYYLTTYSNNIKKLLEATQDTTNTPQDILNIYDTNDYKTKLNSDLQNRINYIRPTLYSMALDIKNSYNEFNVAYNNGSSARANMEKARKELRTNVINFKTYFDYVTQNSFPLFVINNSLKTQVSENIDIALEGLSASVFNGTIKQLSDYANLKTQLDSIDTANYFTKTFLNDRSDARQVKLKATTIEEFTKISNLVEANSKDIESNIKSKRTDESIKNIQFEITNYKLLGKTYLEYLTDKIKISLHNDYRSDEFTKLYGYKFSEFNIYETQERISTNKYYLDNNIYENSFNKNFAFMQSSSSSPNAFDFMYFSMEICTVLIIIFAMMLICNLITSETESGTIKLLLTRPYKRSKIISAKLFATLLFVLIFILFSAVISFAGGYFMYGTNFNNVLMVFNSTAVTPIHPLLLMLINIFTLLLDATFYTLLALMISILFKNYAGSISLCLVIILVTYTFNMLFGGMFWYSLLPSTNLHLFKYFGNSFIIGTNSVFQNILITPIQSTMNIWYSLLLLASYSTIFVAVSYTVFNKRDF